jgi:hypothetical protein
MPDYLEVVRRLGPLLFKPAREFWPNAPGAGKGQIVDVLVRLLNIRRRDGRLSQWKQNTAQESYVESRTERNIILKARQVGMTTYIAARYFLLTLFRAGTVTLQVAHTQESAQQIFRIVRRFFESWRSLRRDVVTDRSTLRELAFADSDSRYLVDTAGNPRVGRGLTIHNLHASEVALWPGDPRETMASLLAAVAPGGQVDVESTPHGVGGYFHSEWLRAKRREPGAMTPHFFPWWMEPSYVRPLEDASAQSLSPDEQQLIERERLTPEQIAFRRWIRAAFGELAPQEYAENDAECFLLAGRPVFETAAIERRLRELPEPVTAEHNGALLCWYPPERGRTYIIGADVAEGHERGDYSAASVVDAVSGLQCAELLERWPIWRFAQVLDALGRRYNTALIAVERNNHGHAVLNTLRHQLHYPRLYRHRGLHGAVKPCAADGWPMNAQTKPATVQCLAGLLRDAPEVFSSARLLEQCRSFSWTEDGGMAARGSASSDETSAHDDLVIAMAIALAVREQAPPLELLTATS